MTTQTIEAIKGARIGDEIEIYGVPSIAVECKGLAPAGCCKCCPVIEDDCDLFGFFATCIERGMVFKRKADLTAALEVGNV